MPRVAAVKNSLKTSLVIVSDSQTMGEKTPRMPSDTEHDKALLKAHRLHAGVYRRVADKLGVDPSYVSRVAAGKRTGERFGVLL